MKRLTLTLIILLSLTLVDLLGGPSLAEDPPDGGSEVNLEVEVVEPEPTPSGGGRRPPTYTVETDLFGSDESFKTDYKGEVQKTVEATSEDGNLTITILEGTTALGEDGKRLRSLDVSVNENPPEPPEDSSVIGLAYNFEPTGATFNPPITFTWVYDPEDFPGGVADLVLAYYDEETSEWTELQCTVDPVNNTVTASVSHFTTFAIMGRIPPMVILPPEPEKPEVIEPVEPAVEDPVIEEPEEPVEPVKPDEPDESEELVIVEDPSGWSLLDSILVGVVVVALTLLLWWWRKRMGVSAED